MAPDTTPQTYLLPADELEALRLRDQQEFVVELFEGQLVLAPVQLDAESTVLDVGTGSGAWALDLIKTYRNADKANVIGVDIGPRLFPVEHPSNMVFKVASVLTLPTEWENTFSLVHQRLLIAGLKYDDWPFAVKEIFRVTARGGWAQLCEVNTMKTIIGPISAKCWKLFTLLEKQAGMDFACAQRIPTLLAEAGFIDIQVEGRVVKFGPSSGEIENRIANNLLTVCRAFKAPILRAGGFGIVKTEQEFDSLMDEMKEEWDTKPGAEYEWFIFVGKKPEY